MTKYEFEQWKKFTQKSRLNWVIDPIHNGVDRKDLIVHKGGVNGQFVTVDESGLVTVGHYTAAIPHIGEAIFQPVGKVQCDNFENGVARIFKALKIYDHINAA